MNASTAIHPSSSSSPLQAVVFDMDGVLIDTEIVWQRVREDFAQSIGARWTTEDQESTMGTNTAAWSRIMVERLQLRERNGMDEAAIAREIVGRMLAQYRRHLPLRAGAVEAVRMVARSHAVALATGSPAELAHHVLQASGLAPLMQAVVCGDDVEHGKPAPDIYLLALSRLGIAPQAAVGIEDSANGLRSLKAAGMAAIAAPGPDYPLSAEALALADLRIDTMEALTPGLLQQAHANANATRAPR